MNTSIPLKDKLKAGVWYCNPWGFSLNEGGYGPNLHISWLKSHYYFFFYCRIWGDLRISKMWKKCSFEKQKKAMLHRASMTYEDSMRNGVVVRLKEESE